MRVFLCGPLLLTTSGAFEVVTVALGGPTTQQMPVGGHFLWFLVILAHLFKSSHTSIFFYHNVMHSAYLHESMPKIWENKAGYMNRHMSRVLGRSSNVEGRGSGVSRIHDGISRM